MDRTTPTEGDKCAPNCGLDERPPMRRVGVDSSEGLSVALNRHVRARCSEAGRNRADADWLHRSPRRVDRVV